MDAPISWSRRVAGAPEDVVTTSRVVDRTGAVTSYALFNLQRERGLGLSAAINELARAGFAETRMDFHYTHPSFDLGLRVDLTSVADVLELLDESDRAAGHAS